MIAKLHIVIWSVATVPTACGIETASKNIIRIKNHVQVATVPTACGIETNHL